MRAQHRLWFATFVSVWAWTGQGLGSARAATFSLKAVKVNAISIEATNDVAVFPGDEITVECFLSGWDTDVPGGGLDTYQFTIDGINSYFTGTSGRVFPVGFAAPPDLTYCDPQNPVCPPSTPDCRNMLDGTSRCTHRCETHSDCPPAYNLCQPEGVCTDPEHNPGPYAFVDASRPDFAHYGAGGIWVVRNSFTIQYAYGSAAASFHPPDPGTPVYAGTLILEVSGDAAGTFVIQFDDTILDPNGSSRTFVVVDGAAGTIPVIGEPLRIAVGEPQDPPGGGATFSLKAVKVNGVPIEATNHVMVWAGDVITADCFLSNWNANAPGGGLDTYQFTIDGVNSFFSGTSGRVFPVGYGAPPDVTYCTNPNPMCPPETPHCRYMLDGTSRCSLRCDVDADCPSEYPECRPEHVCTTDDHNPGAYAFVDASRPDFAHFGASGIWIVRNAFTIQYVYGSTAASFNPIDPGVPAYVGTLTLEVSADAAGIFVIQFDDAVRDPVGTSHTFMVIGDAGDFFPLTGEPLTIEVIDPQHPPGGGATYSIKAVKVNGVPIVPTNNVAVRPGAVVTAEVFLSGWNRNQPGGKLNTYQFTIDGINSYFSGPSGHVFPMGYNAPWDVHECSSPNPICPVETPDCRDMLDGTSRCTIRCTTSADCPFEFPTCRATHVCAGPGHDPDDYQLIDTAKPDYVFGGLGAVAVVRNDYTIQFVYGATMPSDPVVEDLGFPYYVGTLMLGVSDDALGMFVIGIDESEGSPESRSYVELDEPGNVFFAGGVPLSINVVTVDPIPTVSGWGLAILALAMLTGAKVRSLSRSTDS